MATSERPLVAVLDYGIGNLRSAQKGLERVGADARLTADPLLIADAAGVVLPGVGAFGRCADELRAAGLEPLVHDAVASGRPFLGICIGMQLLYEGSEESPGVPGLGVLPGKIQLLPDGVKRPQMQWNALQLRQPDDPIFDGLRDAPAWMYFVHSLHGVPDDPAVVIATTEYGSTLNAVFRSGNVVATQFHPEKSAQDGLRLLANFARVTVASR